MAGEGGPELERAAASHPGSGHLLPVQGGRTNAGNVGDAGAA